MCLYERKLTNGKYEPSIKNGGNVPKCNDYRQLYIKVGCGWCCECRKKIANEWRVRLYEEIKDKPNATFVTLTFSPENIDKLETEIYTKKYRGIETDENGEIELDVNILAAYAIRMWSERWRKKHKKAPRHWLITELGHTNSERIHLHGLVWNTTPEEIEKTWKYGQTYCGQWVDNRTINYIVKYVTKLDQDHKGYRQRTFVSKGIGLTYIDRRKNWHRYNEKETITYYKTYNGHKIGLPRYWKIKLWNDEQREKLWSYELDKNIVWLTQEKWDTTNESREYIEQFRKSLQGIRSTNINSGWGDNKTCNKTYIITPLMKMKKDKIDINREKFVKCKPSRILQNITPYKEEHESIGKHMNVDINHWGEYIGNLTEAKRNYNILVQKSNELQVSVKKLRLFMAGILSESDITHVTL